MVKPEDFFAESSGLSASIICYGDDVHAFIRDYYSLCMKCGIIIEERLMPPENSQISYLKEKTENGFELSESFLMRQIHTWLPQIKPNALQRIAASMFSVLNDLRKNGKNDTVLENAYVKFMCWIYYRFQSVAIEIDSNAVPKILYGGKISPYELYMLEILRRCGCNVLILDYGADDKLHMDSFFPGQIFWEHVDGFPEGFSLSGIKKEILEKQKADAVIGRDDKKVLLNGWMETPDVNQIMRPPLERCMDKDTVCGSFLLINGVENRNDFTAWLYDFVNGIDREKVLFENGVTPPGPDDTKIIKRTECRKRTDVLFLIADNVKRLGIPDAPHAIHCVSGLIHEKDDIRKQSSDTLWYLGLLAKYKKYIGGCLLLLNEIRKKDWTFLHLMAMLGSDTVIFNPSKKEMDAPDSCFAIEYDDTLSITKFPAEKTEAFYSTTAFNAENDFTSLMHGDTGIYRDRQYGSADSVVLKTMYEEIETLWDEPLNMRDGFHVSDGRVTIPVIFAKVCGVKNRNMKKYAKDIEKLVKDNPNVLYVNNRDRGHTRLLDTTIYPPGDPFYSEKREGEPEVSIASVMKGGMVDYDKLIRHKEFSFGYMREETLRHMADKLNLMLSSKTIAKMGKNKTENKLLRMFFNMPKHILDMIQSFDFTKINPKIVYVNTSDDMLSLEETMMIQYLSFIGFDIVMFIPTGYNVIEKHFDAKLFTEHQIGDFVFDAKLNIKTKKGLFGL